MDAILATEIGALEQLGASYDTLLQKVGGIESLYYSLDYIRTSLDTFEALGAALFFIVVFEDEEVVAVLPFQRVANRAFGFKSTIRFWGECNIYAHNLYQKILVEGYRPDAMDAAVSFLNKKLGRKWDTIEFTRTKMEDENIRYFVSRFQSSTVKLSPECYYYFDAGLNLDRHLGAKRMKNLRRYRRHLEKDFGTVDFVVKETVEPADTEEIKGIHTARQEFKKNGGAFFSSSMEDRYVSNLLKMWSGLKCVRYYSLRVDGKPIAINVMIHAARISYSFLIAFDSQFKKYSPSRILEYESDRHEMEHFQAERIETGWGTNQFKKDHASGGYALHDVEILNQRVKSKTVHFVINRIISLREKSRAIAALLKRAAGTRTKLFSHDLLEGL